MNGRTALIFGGSGAIGRTVAALLARRGVHVHIGARDETGLERVASAIHDAGGTVSTFKVDVLDGEETARQAALAANKLGGIDIVVNATSFMHDQGKDIGALSLTEFKQGFDPFLVGLFNISKASAAHMGGERPGVFITVVAPAARMAMPGHLGHIVGCAGVEAYTKAFASEVGPRNIRVLCVRSHAIADAVAAQSYTGELFAPKAQAMGLSVPEWLNGAAQSTMLKRLPTLDQVAGTIAFLVSDEAQAMTGSIVNLTAGATTEQ